MEHADSRRGSCLLSRIAKGRGRGLALRVAGHGPLCVLQVMFKNVRARAVMNQPYARCHTFAHPIGQLRPLSRHQSQSAPGSNL